MTKYEEKNRSILITLIIIVYLGYPFIYYFYRHHFRGINNFVDAIKYSTTLSFISSISRIYPITSFGRGLVISNVAIFTYIICRLILEK